MNYGKLALLRQEDYESSLARPQESLPLKRSVYLNCLVKPFNRLKLFRVCAPCVIVNLSLHCFNSEAKISLYADAMLVSAQNYSPSMTFTLTLDSAALRTLSIESDCDFSVERAEILVLNGALEEPQISAAADEMGDSVGFVCAQNGQIRLSIFESIEECDYLTVGFGDLADISACSYNKKDCFCVSYRDFYNNVFLVFVAKHLGIYSVIDAQFITNGADTLSLAHEGGNLVFAYTHNGMAHIKSVFGKDSLSVEADELCLVKNCFPITALLTHNGLNSLRMCAEQLWLNVPVQAALSVSAE